MLAAAVIYIECCVIKVCNSKRSEILIRFNLDFGGGDGSNQVQEILVVVVHGHLD